MSRDSFEQRKSLSTVVSESKLSSTTPHSLYTYAVALLKTHSDTSTRDTQRQNGGNKMCTVQGAWRQSRKDQRSVSIFSL